MEGITRVRKVRRVRSSSLMFARRMDRSVLATGVFGRYKMRADVFALLRRSSGEAEGDAGRGVDGVGKCRGHHCSPVDRRLVPAVEVNDDGDDDGDVGGVVEANDDGGVMDSRGANDDGGVMEGRGIARARRTAALLREQGRIGDRSSALLKKVSSSTSSRGIDGRGIDIDGELYTLFPEVSPAEISSLVGASPSWPSSTTSLSITVALAAANTPVGAFYTDALLNIVRDIYTAGWPLFGILLYSAPLLPYIQIWRQTFQRIVADVQRRWAAALLDARAPAQQGQQQEDGDTSNGPLSSNGGFSAKSPLKNVGDTLSSSLDDRLFDDEFSPKSNVTFASSVLRGLETSAAPFRMAPMLRQWASDHKLLQEGQNAGERRVLMSQRERVTAGVAGNVAHFAGLIATDLRVVGAPLFAAESVQSGVEKLVVRDLGTDGGIREPGGGGDGDSAASRTTEAEKGRREDHYEPPDWTAVRKALSEQHRTDPHVSFAVCHLDELILYFALARMFPSLRIVQDLTPPRPFLLVLERVLSCLVANSFVPKQVVNRFNARFLGVEEEFVAGRRRADKDQDPLEDAFRFFSLLPDEDPYDLEEFSIDENESASSPSGHGVPEDNAPVDDATEQPPADFYTTERDEGAGGGDPLFAKPAFTRTNLVWFLLFFLLHEHQLLFYQYSVCPRGEPRPMGTTREVDEDADISHAMLTRSYEERYLSCHSDRTVLTEIQNGGVRSRGFLAGYSHFAGILEEQFRRQRHPTTELHGGSPRSCNAVLDVGANVGGYAIHLALHYNLTVIAVDPLPENANNLRATVQANGLEGQVIVVQAAIADTSKKAGGLGKPDRREQLYLYERPEETGQSALLTEEQASWSREVDYLQSTLDDANVAPADVRKKWRVVTVGVDELFEQEGWDDGLMKVCLVKIDAEGAALTILESAKKLLERDRPALVVELDSAVARAVWPPLVRQGPVVLGGGGGSVSEDDPSVGVGGGAVAGDAAPNVRSGSLGGAVVDFLHNELGFYKTFQSFEDFAVVDGTKNPDYADYATAWQIQILKELRLGVWTAIFYKNALWDGRFSKKIADIRLSFGGGALSAAQGSEEAEEEHRPGDLSLEVLGADVSVLNTLQFGSEHIDLERIISYFQGRIDRLYVVCAQLCTANLLVGCRGFDLAATTHPASAVCRLYSSCAGFEWRGRRASSSGGEGASSTEQEDEDLSPAEVDQSPLDKFGRPRVPEMGILGAWDPSGKDRNVKFRAMELDNDLVAFADS